MYLRTHKSTICSVAHIKAQLTQGKHFIDFGLAAPTPRTVKSHNSNTPLTSVTKVAVIPGYSVI